MNMIKILKVFLTIKRVEEKYIYIFLNNPVLLTKCWEIAYRIPYSKIYFQITQNLKILRQFIKKTKLLIKKVVGQWFYLLYFQKSLKKLFMISLVNIWKNTSVVYYAVFGKLVPHNMLCSNYCKHGQKNETNLVLWEQY